MPDLKKRILTYYSRKLQWMEESLLKRINFKRGFREALYQALGYLEVVERNYMKADLSCPTLFEKVDDSRAVYVPAYNPEPSWALGRNILNPNTYPELGVEGALDLREKNYNWRRRKLMEALAEKPYHLLMSQFQYIDSTQHLYLSYHDPSQMNKVEEAYWRMDEFAGEILAASAGKYDRVLFLSDNGAARKSDYRPTHYNRPYYSLSHQENIRGNNLRDFFHHILSWIRSEPNPGVVNE